MGQVKVYGLKKYLKPNQKKLSQIIHNSIVKALAYPEDKKFHRFFLMDEENFIFPDSKSKAYTIIEISLFEGRSVEAKKLLIREIYQRVEKELEMNPNDVEITISETSKSNWGIRGVPGDELALNYEVNV